jgi:DNA-directed RNA polymerase subunit RPC12/RpoP
MAKEKCSICGKEIERGFMDKIIGTIIKTKKDNKTQIDYICNTCQKEQTK